MTTIERIKTQHSLVDDESSQTTLWMGDLDPWMDELYLHKLWSQKGEQVVIKLIRDKRSGNSVGYAFIGFKSILAAQRALTTLHGTKMPESQTPFRLNWAAGGGIFDKKEDRAPEYSLFVGDLSNDIDETYLLATFRQRYASCHSAKIMTDPVSGLSRGYGFVRFHDPLDQQSALVQMNGVYCGHRPLRVSLATPKGSNSTKISAEASILPSAPLSPLSSSSTASSSLNNPNTVTQQMQARYHQLALQAPALVQQPTDPSNTTVFVGGLSAPINEEELRLYFASFGDITYVKIPPGKGCGFVQFVTRQAAEWAIEQMNGYQIGQSRIRLSWGRSQYDKPGGGGLEQQQRSPPMMIQRETSSIYIPPVSPTLSSPLSSYSLGNHDSSVPKRTMATQPIFSIPTTGTATLPPNQPSYSRNSAQPINLRYDVNPYSHDKQSYPPTLMNNHSPPSSTPLFGPSPTSSSHYSPKAQRPFSLLTQQDDDPPYYHGMYSPSVPTPSSTLMPLSTSPYYHYTQEQQSASEWPSAMPVNRVRTTTMVSDQDSARYWQRPDDIYA